jgi:octanoyl-[GcvH]:protein N-octanoyltransferase
MRDAPELDILTASRPGDAQLDTAITHALLRQVAAGTRRETLRLYRPDPTVVFSLLDARRPGFGAALQTAREADFASVLRLGGGHAALFHAHTLAFSWATPEPVAHHGVQARFEQIATRIARVLIRLGVDAQVGCVPREYCPGDHSVNAGGRVKLMGVGQRVIRGAAHVGGMIVVDDSAGVRRVLEPVYRALELDWDPATAGSVSDEIGTTSLETVRDAMRADLAERYTLHSVDFDTELLDLARSLTAWHDPLGDPKARRGHGLVRASGKTLAVGTE